MEEGDRVRVDIKVFCVNCPAWLSPKERAQIMLLHTTNAKAREFAENPLDKDHHHVFDFANNTWNIQHVPVPHP